MCQVSCAVFYSETRVPGPVFFWTQKAYNVLIFLSVTKVLFACKFNSYFLSPIGAEIQLCVRHPARCFILTQGYLARCFVLTKKSYKESIFLSVTKVLFA